MKPAKAHYQSLAVVPFLVIIAILASTDVLHAQVDNLGMLQRYALVIADSLIALTPPGDTLCIRVAPHPAAWLIEQATLTSAENHGIHVLPCTEAFEGGMSVAISSIGIQYLEVDDPDSVSRSIHLSLTAALDATPEGRSRQRLTRVFSVVHSDTVNAGETSSLENSGYDFTRGSAPSRSSGGFWSRVIEPAVILGASVVMVILLFTVRSQ